MDKEQGAYMPPKDGKELLDIIDNLNEFAEKLLSRIADESDEGCKQLVHVLESARARYNKPIESWLKGWFYQFTRKRGQEIDMAIKGMEAFPDAYTRLQEFKLLVGKGEWEHGSFNYYLFDELIKSVPGYKPLESELVHPIILKLRQKINKRIDEFMSQYLATQKLIEARKQELLQTHQSAQKFIDNVSMTNNLEAAKKSAKENKGVIQFCLIFESGIWKLSWVDATGKVYALEPGEELIQILIDAKIKDIVKDIDNLSALHLKQLKQECVKAREMLLGRVQLLINPKDPRTQAELTNDVLKENGTSATFVLRGKPNEYSLWWINTLGFAHEISLESYASMKTWLNDQGHPLKEEHIPQLKTYLLNVNTIKSIDVKEDMKEFKAQLQECLAAGPKSKIPPASGAIKTTNAKKLDLRLFGDVERCLRSQLSERQEEKAAIQEPGKINLNKYENIATLFGNRAKNMEQHEGQQSKLNDSLSIRSI
ncbi:TPA: Dot/Icm T4SS effector RavH [Legionella pneumophila]|uniref:Dot/Icm T4SS effector RavH n=1 Tax=Legionella pneumophila TaxID=446 RepID=UPI0009AF9B20|nr:Dot/Icm T4SS effector RavH [Legionella pneumophila]HAT9115429.1 Dot/Icm T4SS effector RavH [Legionella pneumophila subsp. pneumophila]MCH9075887.1 Dot/Icm T4SS effector RavH [Legionella pneumophila serogroup 1]MCH9097047.1 Dot/Icm T4SS effector RavH [Legionella pneumophila serogroup 1]MCH9105881.1 Dot/Icm T4SS effector RavH [Legionella pneumophila serogroup 1]MCH9121076.1 Dot/Icm T4SS effector RavH [Legionella pneumophila serogroup 1]